jgi:hypothetical protein
LWFQNVSFLRTICATQKHLRLFHTFSPTSIRENCASLNCILS